MASSVSILAPLLLMVLLESPPPTRPLGLVTTVRSPSGEYCMTVSPDVHGNAGAATYVLSQVANGKPHVVWQGERRFHAYQYPLLTDSGWFAGFASRHSEKFQGGIALVAVAVAPDGKTRIEEDLGLEFDGKLAWVPRGVVMHPSAGRALYRVTHGWETQEEWRSYDLSAGREANAFDPAGLQASDRTLRELLGIVPVPNTDLLLVRWLREGSIPLDVLNEKSWQGVGSRISLIRADSGSSVWSHDEPDDLGAMSYGQHWKKIERLRAQPGGGLRCDPSGTSFTVRLITKMQDLRFSLDRAPGNGWRAKEVERTPWRMEAKGMR